MSYAAADVCFGQSADSVRNSVGIGKDRPYCSISAATVYRPALSAVRLLRRILYEPEPFMRRDQVFFGTPIARFRYPWRTLHHEVQDFEQALSHRDVTLVTGLMECQSYPVG
jgi:hypothetical protein